MDGHSLSGASRNRTLLPIFLVAIASLAVAFGLVASRAQTDQGTPGERQFDNTIPEHVPVEVKLKSEKSFKDPKNKGWARELELEVRNTGRKPIYYIYLIVHMPDFVLEDGAPLSFRVKYGKHWLAGAGDPAQPDEPPIPPGASITLKIPESKWKAYETLREEKRKGDPKQVRLELQIIDFGDGTGFASIKGVPLTYPREKSSLEKTPAKAEGRTCKPPPEPGWESLTVSFFKTVSFTKPVNLLRVNFLLAEPTTFLAPPTPRDLCNCQNVSSCFFGKLTCPYQCPCDFHASFLPTFLPVAVASRGQMQDGSTNT